MILNTAQRKEFEQVSRLLIKFLNNNCHPHVTVVVNTTRAELSEGICTFVTDAYLKD